MGHGEGGEAGAGVGPSPCGRARWGTCLLACGASTRGSGDGTGVAGGGHFHDNMRTITQPQLGRRNGICVAEPLPLTHFVCPAGECGHGWGRRSRPRVQLCQGKLRQAPLGAEGSVRSGCVVPAGPRVQAGPGASCSLPAPSHRAAPALPSGCVPGAVWQLLQAQLAGSVPGGQTSPSLRHLSLPETQIAAGRRQGFSWGAA